MAATFLILKNKNTIVFDTIYLQDDKDVSNYNSLEKNETTTTMI